MNPETELDCRGQVCPLPVIALARAVSEMALGDVVAVVSTDPAAAADILAWCRMKEQEFIGADVADDGTPRFRVRRVS